MADTASLVIDENEEMLEQKLIARAQAIAPKIAERAQQAEQDRRIPDETIQEVRDAELFEILVPKKYGGHELSISSMVKVAKVLSPHDVSTGWVLSFYMIHNWMWCLLSPEAQDEIFANGPARLGPVMVAPTVKAERVDGGYRINGAAKWGTGSSHASWCMVSGIVQEADNLPAADDGTPRPPEVKMFGMPWSEAKVIDTWRTSGMAATASHDVIFDDIFIPEHRAADVGPARAGVAPGASIHESNIYSCAFTPMLAISALAPLVGGALGAAQHAIQRSKDFLSTYSGKSSADNPALQIRLAKANLMAENASLLIDQLAKDIISDSQSVPVPIESRARQRAQASYAASLCRDCVTLLAQGAGASGHMADSPIQRAFRDINMASCHVVFDQDPTMELHGKMLLGCPPAIILA